MSGIFKKNDIRGKYGLELSEQFCFELAVTFHRYANFKNIRLKKIVIAGDSRLSTDTLKLGIVAGLSSMGVQVIDLGLGPSPMVYFAASRHDDIDAGIMITASHNPKEYNGIKICDSTGAAYHYDNLYGWLQNNMRHQDGKIHLIHPEDGEEYRLEYYNNIIHNIHLTNPLKIAVEVGNGATGEFIPYLKKMGCDIHSLNENPDGDFPVMLPDPTKPSTFDGIINLMKKEKIDLGIAFDGDGDRVGFILNDGSIISPDKIIMLYADDVLSNKPQSKLIIDIKVSKATADYIDSKGGQTILSKVGHSWIHENLVNENASFAGELSGHYYFHDTYEGFDDGLYSAMRMIKILDNFISQGRDFNRFVYDLPSLFTTQEYRINQPFSVQERVLEKLKNYVVDNNAELITLDGIRGEFPDGWFIVRSSSTEEKLSYRVEGNTKIAMDRILRDIEKIIEIQ